MFNFLAPKKPSTTEKNESRRPKDTKYIQQTLPAWRPVLRAGSVYPIFLVIGTIFIPVGAVFFVAASSVQEVSISYTHCHDDITKSMCSEELKKPEFFGNFMYCNCTENFTIPASLNGQVYAYYGLTNFYQNYRQYMQSRDDSQMRGVSVSSVRTECAPYDYQTTNDTQLIVTPCGLIANSIFNDTFTLIYLGVDSNESIPVNMTSKGIAWPTDVNAKFGKPSSWNGTIKPENWPVSAFERNPGAFNEDEELLVWMRNAALPTFRKLHRIINHQADGPFENGLPAGNYVLKINYAFPVTAFDGTKRFILTTKGWLGGKNPTLGIAYIAAGAIHIVLGIVLVFVHIRAGNKSPHFTCCVRS